eukprot:416994-Prorocentrum_minimum.AAC.1
MRSSAGGAPGASWGSAACHPACPPRPPESDRASGSPPTGNSSPCWCPAAARAPAPPTPRSGKATPPPGAAPACAPPRQTGPGPSGPATAPRWSPPWSPTRGRSPAALVAASALQSSSATR